MRRLNIGCGTHYAEGWVNVDVVYLPEHDTTPDVVADPLQGLPFPDGSADRIYLGHVLEHVDWEQVVPFVTEIRRVIAPDGQLMVTGPDAKRTIERWVRGEEPDWLLWSVLEHAALFSEGGEGWHGSRHSWNCYEERAADLVEHAGFVIGTSYTGALAQLVDLGWPFVNDSQWQFGFSATPLP